MSSLPWIAFVLLVLLLLGLDLGLLNRRPHAISARQALRWTAFWVAIALTFNVAIWFIYEHGWFGIGTLYGTRLTGEQAALQFFTAYLVEESLSVDNLFVMALVFRAFSVPERYQHRVLFLGIVGALVFRATFILAGLALITLFHWTVYVFGGLLVFTAVRMLFAKDDAPELKDNLFVRLARRFVPITNEYHEEKLLVRLQGKLYATPLLLALVVIETSDVIFAVDSVPAVLGVTQDPFIAFTSNVFAILGLRSLYFALAAVLSTFQYLKVSLVLVLSFVGIKMLLMYYLPIDSRLSLLIIVGLLAGGVIASIIAKRRAEPTAPKVEPQPEHAQEEA